MKTKLSWFDRMMFGVTFAEANVPEMGKELMDESSKKGRGSMAEEERDSHLSEAAVHAKALKV